MQINIKKIINKLKESNFPLFVSEKDLQTRFIIEAKHLYSKYLFYPEYPQQKTSNDKKRDHFDLVIFDLTNKQYTVIEFKYVVCGGTIKIPGNLCYKLRNHSGIPARRYKCYQDIDRLETCKLIDNNFKKAQSYFLLITNEHLFWDGTKQSKFTMDREFDLADGHVIKKRKHKWKKKTKMEEYIGQVKIYHK